MDDLSDLDLVEAAEGGDTASFGELVRRHGPRLLALARWEDPDYSVDPALVAARRSQTGAGRGSRR